MFIAVQRLDAESVKVWEHHLGSAKEPPTWNQFSEFLVTRLLSLQAFEKSRIGKGTQQASTAKSHFQGKAKDSTSHKAGTCSICSSSHYTVSCPQYNPKTVQQRLTVITKHRLCYNCLGSHKVSACRTAIKSAGKSTIRPFTKTKKTRRMPTHPKLLLRRKVQNRQKQSYYMPAGNLR